MNKSRFLLGLLLAAAATMPAAADQLTPQQAMDRAIQTGSTHMRAPGVAMRHVYTGLNAGNATYYVFSNTSSEGFCVLAADDVVESAVLGYSDNGSFDPLNIPAPLQYWLECYNAQIGDMIGGARAARICAAPQKATRHDVAPITATKWNQESPYNDLCPLKQNKRSYSGCVATAMAQAMKVYNWPVTGMGSNAYTPNTGVGQQAVNFANSTYDWDNMLDVYDSKATAAQKNAVAKLMYDCGVSVNMAYDITASGASSTAIPGALVNYFKYDKSIQELRRQFYYLDEWIDIIYGEVSEGRPVVMGGSSATGGHAFVIDGFQADGDFFHLNWGWGGMSDGYFKIMGLDPESQGIGGSSAGYNIYQMITIGIQPAKTDSEVIPYMGTNTDFTTKTASYVPSSANYVQFLQGSNDQGIFNYCYQTMYIEIGVKLVNQTTGEVTYLGEGNERSVKLNGGFSSYPIRSDKFPTSGTYTVTPAFKYNGKWYDALVPVNMKRALKLVATSGKLTFTPITSAGSAAISQVKVPTTLYQNRPFELSFKVKALNNEYYESAYLMVISGSSLVAMIDNIQIDVEQNETQEIKMIPFIPASQVAEGSYKLVLMRQQGQNLYTIRELATVNVQKEPTMAYRVSNIVFDGTTEKGSFLSTPAPVSLNQFKMSFNLECQDGYVSDVVTGVFCDRNYNILTSLPGQFVSLEEGQSENITLSGDVSSSLEPNQVYLYTIWGNMIVGQMLSTPKYIKGDITTGIEVVDATENGEIHTLLSPDGATLAAIAATPVASVEVYAINGACVARAAGFDPQLTVNVSSLQAGVYVVRVTLANGTVVSRRIAKR